MCVLFVLRFLTMLTKLNNNFSNLKLNMTSTIHIDSIVIPDRLRKDYGNIDALADSLERYGFLQPVLLDDNNYLIAGGRRLTAARQAGITDIPFYRKSDLPDDIKLEMELEENVQRQEMHWKERALAILKIHRLKESRQPASAASWGHRETGALLNMNVCNVNYALRIAKLLEVDDKEAHACLNMSQGIQLLLRRKEDAAITANMRDDANIQHSPGVEFIPDENTRLIQTDYGKVVSIQAVIRLSEICILSDRKLDWMKAYSGAFDHIITDPPYAIDMDMLQQNSAVMNIEATRDEHEVEYNVNVLRKFISLAFDATKDHSFCILWCDQDNWGWLQSVAIDVGWRVQRWPYVWVKQTQCKNEAAQYNMTKATEIAMVLRKPGAVLAVPRPTNYIICGQSVDRQQFSHPFSKPLLVWIDLLTHIAHHGQTILDPFAGEGSCIMAGLKNGYNMIGAELPETTWYPRLVENVKQHWLKKYNGNVRFE